MAGIPVGNKIEIQEYDLQPNRFAFLSVTWLPFEAGENPIQGLNVRSLEMGHLFAQYVEYFE